MNKMLTLLRIKSMFSIVGIGLLVLLLSFFIGCSTDQKTEDTIMKSIEQKPFNYLALGDSYTIGEAVSADQNFPSQLASKLERELEIKATTKIIATTGWRTDQLLDAIKQEKLEPQFDFVTLLIGVNNQFQNRNFDQYEKEFPELVEVAIRLAKNSKEDVLILSIPDYGFTPFGENRSGVREGVDKYNAFAEKTATEKGIDFLNITDITRRGLQEEELVAEDGLHVSALGYSEFVERIFNLKFKNKDRLRQSN